MAIRPLSVDGGVVQIWDDDRGHGGPVPLSSLRFATKLDGTTDYRFIITPCPVCGGVSIHPASGGCYGEGVQPLMAAALVANKSHPAKTWLEGAKAVQVMSEELDGPGRCKLDPTIAAMEVLPVAEQDKPPAHLILP